MTSKAIEFNHKVQAVNDLFYPAQYNSGWKLDGVRPVPGSIAGKWKCTLVLKNISTAEEKVFTCPDHTNFDLFSREHVECYRDLFHSAIDFLKTVPKLGVS